MSGILGIGGGGSTGFYDFSIEQSLRFNDDDSPYLNRTPSSTGSRTIWTWSCWVKRGNLSYSSANMFSAYSGANDFEYIRFDSDDCIRYIYFVGGSAQNHLKTSASFRDTSAWYHILVQRSGSSSEIYVNGVQQELQTESRASSNGYFNHTVAHNVGRFGGTGQHFDGYLAEMNFVDGTSHDPTSFGVTKNGIWVPKEFSGSYGTNGFRLAFQDSSSFGDDTSGNGHDFTANNFATTDQMPDAPTDNKPTFNYLLKDLKHSTTLSDGNKTISFTSGSSGFSGVPLTIFRNEGKAYCEFNLDRTYDGNSGDSQTIFVVSEGKDFSDIGSGDSSNFEGSYNAGGSSDAAASINDSGVNQGTPTKFRSVNDRVGVYIDFDAGKGFFALNGTVQTVNGTPDIANGTNPHFTFTANTLLTVGAGGIHAGTPAIITLKDDPSDWGTTPPAGYTAFSAAELPDPGIDPNKGETPDEYFNTVTYTGTGATTLSITGVGFQPDWVWAKKRSAADSHATSDVIRGVTKTLFPDLTNAESTDAQGLQSFDSDGFTIGSGSGSGVWGGNSGATYVAWNWKAGGTAVSNSDGDITSSVSASTESGFSIVTYTGTGTNGDTVGHGLTSAPTMIFIKSRVATSADGNWLVYARAGSAGFGLVNETDYLLLNSSVEATDAVGAFNDTATTSTVFSLGTFADLNQSTKTYVAYCFHDVEGYSKVGTYIGNGNADGQFVYTGFRPAWLLLKRTSTSGSWKLFDNKRPNPFNVINARLEADNNVQEDTSSTFNIDLLSNGFKLRGSSGEQNGDGSTFLYLAFAEQPFKYANAR
tara:strand:+ start:3113 stop:5554 length:2442 start_codon:yes stop_codon:yes gene_type:complete